MIAGPTTLPAVTTPDTTAVRAWARENGYDVAGRGRLPADVVQAYEKAQGRSSAAPAKKAATKASAAKASAPRAAAKAPTTTPAKAPAKSAAKAPAKSAAKAPAKAAGKAPAQQAVPAKTGTAEAAASAPAERPAPAPKPSVVSDDRRLVALGEQLQALTDRVAALEKQVGTKTDSGKGKPRFRRR